MAKPTIKELMAAVPISKSYAAVILKDGGQVPPLNLAALIHRETGWRHSIIGQMSDETVAEIADKQPWAPPKKRAA